MSPRFASECEPPIAWTCPNCGLVQLESGGRPFTTEETAAIQALVPSAAGERLRRRTLHPQATEQAREILEAFGAQVPIEVEALADRLGFPVRWRTLPGGYRGGVEGDAEHRVLVLNRDYPFHSDVERRWVVAEELAHAVLGHGTLVASATPGRPAEGEASGQARESEAKAFAAELLMPPAQLRAAFAREQAVILRALGRDEREQAIRTVIADLAREFRVSQQAMRIRLGQLGLLT